VIDEFIRECLAVRVARGLIHKWLQTASPSCCAGAGLSKSANWTISKCGTTFGAGQRQRVRRVYSGVPLQQAGRRAAQGHPQFDPRVRGDGNRGIIEIIENIATLEESKS
jgi:hypothetical protein